MSNENAETMNATAKAVQAAMNQKARDAVTAHRNSGLKLIESYRDFVASHSKMSWEDARNEKSKLVAATERFLWVAMQVFLNEPAAVQDDKDNWGAIGRKITSGLNQSCLAGSKVNCRYRENHKEASGMKDHDGETYAYMVDHRPTSDGKARWLEFQWNSGKVKTDSLDKMPIIADLTPEPVEESHEQIEETPEQIEETPEQIEAREKRQKALEAARATLGDDQKTSAQWEEENLALRAELSRLRERNKRVVTMARKLADENKTLAAKLATIETATPRQRRNRKTEA